MKIIQAAVILLLISIYSCLAFADSSECKPDANSCEYYLCKEINDPCGVKGYWLAYGYKYCRIFLTQTDSFSNTSKIWMYKARYCLQQALQLETKDRECSEDRKVAMDSHVACYIQSGFCSLSLKDRSEIIWLLRSAFTQPMTYVEGLEVEYQCTLKGQNLNYD